MKTCGSRLAFWLSAGVFIAACGGGAKPAESPEASAGDKPAADKPAEGEKADAAEADSAKSDSAKSDDKADAKTEAKSDSKPKPADDGGPKPTRTPTDILTAPDTVFLFSFNDSDAKQAAETKCDEKAGDNPKKKNECMAGERKNFPADGHRFKKDGAQWWWITVRQKGNRLVTMHKIPFEFGEETATSITLKPTGKDKGQAPMNVPAKVVFEVPNDYQIALKDPKLGRLVFQAKIGVVTE
ncbi:MAG TPA: hypothetical protein VHB79_25820 [Polyangiaceae bacterium]|nr:hypothetical protein [Polyangiaceae bacterium]